MTRTTTLTEAANQTGIERATLASRRAELGIGQLIAGPSPYWVLSSAEVRQLVDCRPEGYSHGRPKGAKNKTGK